MVDLNTLKFIAIGFLVGVLATIATLLGVSVLNLPGLSQSPRSDVQADSSKTPYGAADSKLTSNTSQFATLDHLHGLTEIKSNFLRVATFHATLASADEEQLVRFIAQSKRVSNPSQRQWIQEAIFSRLTNLDPNTALVQVEQMPHASAIDLMETIFAEWSLNDLPSAIDHIEKLEGTMRLAAMRGLLLTRDDLSEQGRQNLAKRLGNELLAVDLSQDSKLTLALDDPKKAWQTTMEDARANISQVDDLIRIAHAWVDKSGLSAIDQISESLTSWEIRSTVFSSILHRIAQTNPEEAFLHALKFEGDHNNYLLSILTQEWATTDPDAAMSAIDGVESPVLRSYLYDSVVRGWAERNPQGVLQDLGSLPENFQVLAREVAIQTIAKTERKEAAQLIPSVENESSRAVVAFSVASNWAKLNAHEALDWVINDPEVRSMRRNLLGTVLEELTELDPQLALSTALEQPIETDQIGMESRVITRLAWTDVEKALELLPRVRAGQTKILAYASVGGALVHNGKALEALEMANQLPENQRNRYYETVANSWARHDPVDLLSNIEKLPTPEIRSHAARFLVDSNTWHRVLTDDQVKHAKTFLPDEQLR